MNCPISSLKISMLSGPTVSLKKTRVSTYRASQRPAPRIRVVFFGFYMTGHWPTGRPAGQPAGRPLWCQRPICVRWMTARSINPPATTLFLSAPRAGHVQPQHKTTATWGRPRTAQIPVLHEKELGEFKTLLRHGCFISSQHGAPKMHEAKKPSAFNASPALRRVPCWTTWTQWLTFWNNKDDCVLMYH